MSSIAIRFRSRQRGFTLAEILVTTAIFAIIMLAALAVYDQSNKTFKSSTESADMQQSTRVGFEKLVSDIRMAGFDYSRGGVPNDTWQAVQPDEQIEYAGETAVVFRSNFNYNTATAPCGAPGPTAAPCGNGIEQALTPVNVNGGAIFPYVTTSNDEIVAYVLKSNDATKNTSTFDMYLDDYSPRSVFPSSLSPAPAASNPSKKEAKVTVSGIDTTNANPPYTLYRMTLTDILNNQPGTPVAENIRSLRFQYYTDAQGQTTVRTAANGVIPAGCTDAAGTCTGAIGGDGQYDPNAPNFAGAGSFADRNQRAQIQSIRVNLVGMNASPDLQGYTNPTETIGTIKSYRQYALSSLVVPRNLGKTGFPEPANSPPAPPQIIGMCSGYCGAPVIYWTAPSGGASVLQYIISWDTSLNGAFAPPHQYIVNDPNATMAVIPDTFLPTDDLSQTWHFRMVAVNDNGASSPSNDFTLKPMNATKPAAPPAANISASTNQPSQITLQWNGPTTNVSPNTLSCSGTGNTDGSVIQSGEVIKYRVWRGTRADFDPRSGCTGPQCGGVAVLRLSSGSQPPPSAPGSQVQWIDNAVNEQLPQGGQAPAACTNYYYRIQAVDRCVLNSAYEVSGNVADSESDFSPKIDGTPNAILGTVTSAGSTPMTPVGLTTPGGPNPIPMSGCPDPANPTSSYCSIVLQWTPVTNDQAGNAIGVDTYRITRKWKHQNNLPFNTYQLDTTFGTGGMMDISGFSQQTPNSNGKLQWIDTTALVSEPNPPFAGTAMTYEYTVAAKTCSTYSAESNAADFPTPCSINPTIVQVGATNYASGSTAGGDTVGTAWILNAGDTITVTPPAGVTFSSVNFNVTVWPTGAPVDNQTVVAPGPYTYTWSDRSDGQVYQVTITVTEATPSAGCQEVHIKYVQDQFPAGCAFLNQPIPAVAISTSGSTATATSTLTLTNTGTEPAYFNLTSGKGSPFAGKILENWADPTGGVHPSLAASAFVYNYTGPVIQPTPSTPSFNTSDNFSFTTSPVGPRAYPAVVQGVNGTNGTNNSFTLQVKWTYKKSETPALAVSPLQKLCLSYRILSEPAATKFCNVVGQSATTNNPTACD